MRVKGVMYCPSCNCECDSAVIDSTCAKLTQGKVIRRRRVCSKCKKKFSTYEIPASNYKELLDAREKARVISNAIVMVMDFTEKYKGDEGIDKRGLYMIGGDDDG